jgi:hypothetical protein
MFHARKKLPDFIGTLARADMRLRRFGGKAGIFPVQPRLHRSFVAESLVGEPANAVPLVFCAFFTGH